MNNNIVANKKVAYYTGCFSNYYCPNLGKATMEVLQKNNVEVVVPDQQCCGLPMVSKGNYVQARKYMEFNTRKFSELVSKGYAVLTSCSSCNLFIKRDYPHFLESPEAKLVSENLFHITEYLLKLDEIGELNKDFSPVKQTVFYHTPCHLRVELNGDGNPTLRVLQMIPGVDIKKVSEICCGMGGAYGYEKTNFKLSKGIAQKLYSEIKENPTDTIVTDCGGCRMQIEAGTGHKADHPSILLKKAYRL
jgi:glycerol-3-phosphate dehydrogenase subunit C